MSWLKRLFGEPENKPSRASRPAPAYTLISPQLKVVERVWSPIELARTLNRPSNDFSRTRIDEAVRYIRTGGLPIFVEVFRSLPPSSALAIRQIVPIARSIGEPAVAMLLGVLKETTPEKFGSSWWHAAELLALLQETRAIALIKPFLPALQPTRTFADGQSGGMHLGTMIGIIGEIGGQQSIEVLVDQLHISIGRVKSNPTAKFPIDIKVLEKAKDLLRRNLKQHVGTVSVTTLQKVLALDDLDRLTATFCNGEEDWDEAASFEFASLRSMAHDEIQRR